ncbi:hypothetical protein PFISCL1PPCAC_18385, partial [Pristionchus fissidentatus]
SNRDTIFWFISIVSPFPTLPPPEFFGLPPNEQRNAALRERRIRINAIKRLLFQATFQLYNRYSGAHRDERITLGNMTDGEKQEVRECFPEFLSGLYEEDEAFFHKDGMREQISGMVYFRLEVLPAFIEFMDQSGQEFSFSLSSIASMETRVRSKMWEFLEEDEAQITRTEMCLGDFVEASDHIWFNKSCVDFTEDIASEYLLED